MTDERIKIPYKAKKFFYHTWLLWAIIIVVTLGGIMIIEALTPAPVSQTWSWNGVLMFLTIAAGIGWIFHGTGFLLVRVK